MPTSLQLVLTVLALCVQQICCLHIVEHQPQTAVDRRAFAAGVVSCAVAAVSPNSATAAEAVSRKIEKCPNSGNCVSTASFRVPSKYAAPWNYAVSTSEPQQAFELLVQAARRDALLKVVEVDAENLYLRCEAKSVVPPDGKDDIEFLIKASDNLVTFRSKSRDTVSIGPVSVGDGGATRNRLENLRFRLGWPEAGVDQYYGDGAQSGVVKRNGSPLDGLGLFDGLRGVKSSYGEDDEPDTITE